MGILLYGKITIVETLAVWEVTTIEDGTITQSRLCVIVTSRAAIGHTSIVAIWVVGISAIETISIGVVPTIAKNTTVPVHTGPATRKLVSMVEEAKADQSELLKLLGKSRRVGPTLFYSTGTIPALCLHYRGTLGARFHWCCGGRVQLICCFYLSR